MLGDHGYSYHVGLEKYVSEILAQEFFNFLKKNL